MTYSHTYLLTCLLIYILTYTYLLQALHVKSRELKNAPETENVDQPVQVLVLVGVEGSSVLPPADGGFGNAGGLAGQRGLNVDRDRDVGAAVGDGRSD